MDAIPPPLRAAVLVLGMHRSGTSALTRLLSLHGLALPRGLMAPRADNPRGFWEAGTVAALNDRILAAQGSAHDDPRPLQLDRPEDFVAEATALLAEEYPGVAPFILKDPRMCRLLPVWLPALARFGAAPRVVLAVRNPLEVARSLARRDGMARPAALALWLSHVLAAERDSRALPRAVLHYDDLLRDWRAELARLGLAPSSAAASFLTPTLRHHEAGTDALLRDPEVPVAVKRIYAELRRAPGETGLDPAPFDAT